MTSCIAQFSFFFYRPKPIRVDFSGGQISSDAGLLPLRAFDQRHGLTRDLAQRLSDPRADERVRHSTLALLRQRLYQIVAGYEDANDADRLRYDPAFQILADQPLGQALGSQPTLTKPFARLRRGTAASPARLVPLLLRLVLRLQKEFPGVRIQLRADAGFPLPLLYEFCEFFGLQYVIGLPTNAVFQRRAARLQRRLARRYRRTRQPQRSFSSFRHRAQSWFRQRRICYKAEHTATGTNLRFLVTNLKGRSHSIFQFYNDRGECENRIEGFRCRPAELPSLPSERLPALVTQFCLQPGQPVPPALALVPTLSPDRNSAHSAIQTAPAFARRLASCASSWPAGGPFKRLFQTVALAFNSS